LKEKKFCHHINTFYKLEGKLNWKKPKAFFHKCVLELNFATINCLGEPSCWNRCTLVPMCEIFELLDSVDFYTIKLLKVGDFRTVIKKWKIFSSDLWFWSLFGENFEFAHAEHAQKIFWS
jgi:hypothetical protein